MQLLVGEAATIPLAVADRIDRILQDTAVPGGAQVQVSDGAILSASIEADGVRVVGIGLGAGKVTYTGPLGEAVVEVDVVPAFPAKVVLQVGMVSFARAS